jgi:hypothetical protein
VSGDVGINEMEWKGWWVMFLWRMSGNVGSEWGCCRSARVLFYGGIVSVG